MQKTRVIRSLNKSSVYQASGGKLSNKSGEII